jgi:hypothetical protein
MGTFDDHTKHMEMVTVNEILKDCLRIEIGKFDRNMQMRVANCLKICGFKKKQDRKLGNKMRYWEKVGTGGAN